MLCAKDVMSTNLLTLTPATTLGETLAIFVEKGISGAPVVDGDELVGVISELGLFDVLFDPNLRSAPVADFMTREVRTIDETESLGHIAHMFALYGIRRLPVLRDGRLAGIVSRRDLLKIALSNDAPLPEPLKELVPSLDEPETLAWEYSSGF